MDDAAIAGWTATLGAFLDVARLIPYPLGSAIPNDIASRIADRTETIDDAAYLAEQSREERRLCTALISPRYTSQVRCPHRTARCVPPHRLATVHDRQLVVAQMGRAPQYPSGWRPQRSLLVSLRLLKEEGYAGINIRCERCEATATFAYEDMRSATPEVPALPGGTVVPNDFCDIDMAAFAEIWGPVADVRQTADTYLVMPESRDRAYRARYANDPTAMTGQYKQLAGYKQRMLETDGIASLAWVAAPDDRAQRIVDPSPGDIPARPDQQTPDSQVAGP